MKLSWTAAKTASFKFECLSREPRLHEPAQTNLEGVVAEGVVVTILEETIPAVPAIIPVVRPLRR